MLQRLYVCYIFERREVQGFQILHWLSSGNDNDTHKDKDNGKDKVFQRPKICYIFQKQWFQGYQVRYFLAKNSPSKKMFTQGFVDPGPEYFSEKNFSGVNIFQG